MTYRILDVGEIIEDGDEVCCSPATTWYPSVLVGSRVPRGDRCRYRRDSEVISTPTPGRDPDPDHHKGQHDHE